MQTLSAPSTFESTVRRYLANCKTSGKSKDTLAGYARTLAEFGEHIGTQTPLEEIAPIHLSDWKLRRGEELKLTSLALYIAHLRCFFAYCEDEGYIEKSPCTKSFGVDKKKVKRMNDKPYEKLLSEDDFRAILYTKHPPGMHVKAIERNRAILAVLLTSGIRNSSLCALTPADLNPSAHSIRIREAKGDKTDDVLLSGVAFNAITRYLEGGYRPSACKDTAPLFGAVVNGKYVPYTRGAMSQVVKYAVKGFCGKEDYRSHAMRHSMAAMLHERGMAGSDIAILLMHSDGETPEVTRRYAGNNHTRQFAAANKIFADIAAGK